MEEPLHPAKDSWSEYSKLVLTELERLVEGQVKMRSDFEAQFKEINNKLSEHKNVERMANEHKTWSEKVTDVWSPIQMKEAKDEIYKQKGRWQATLAILVFLQVMLTLGISLWGKLPAH